MVKDNSHNKKGNPYVPTYVLCRPMYVCQDCQIGFFNAKFQKSVLFLNLIGLRKLIWLFCFLLAFSRSTIIHTFGIGSSLFRTSEMFGCDL